jgi:16S rRNA (guanine1516-N2)-methyltransferase
MCLNASLANVGVVGIGAEQSTQAQTLARQLQLPIIELTDPRYEFALGCTAQGLQLYWLTHPDWKPIQVEFTQGAAAYRQRQGGGLSQHIAKACGIKSPQKPTLLDVTAGLGRDAFVLASLGARVTMLERSPVLAAMLADGLQRLYRQTLDYADRLTLVETDAASLLATVTFGQFDVIYLDPMHPPRQKSALVKKEMRIIRALVGDDIDAAQVLTLARHKAPRVVVKLPRLANTLIDDAPNLQYVGRSTRYDVYLHG